MHIITNAISSNFDRGEVHSIQPYVMKFGSDLRQVGGFLRALWNLPPINLHPTIYLKYCFKSHTGMSRLTVSRHIDNFQEPGEYLDPRLLIIQLY